MSEPWGIPNSWVPSIDGSDQRRAAQEMMNVEHTGAQTRHLDVLTEQAKVQTQRENIQLQMQQRYMQMLSKRAEQAYDKADDIDTQLTEAYRDEMAMGHPDKAARILSEKAAVVNHKEQAKLAREKLDEANEERRVKQRKDMVEVLAAANGPEDYARGIATIQGRYPNAQIPDELLHYSPAAVDYWKRVTKTGAAEDKAKWEREKELDKERMQAEREAAADRRLAARESAADRRQAAREAATDARHRDTEDRIERGKKDSGTKTPDKTTIAAADAVLRRDFPHLEHDMVLGNDKVASAAFDVASEAQALRRGNPALSESQAIATVVKRMKENGSFKEEEQKKGGFLGFGETTEKKTTYKPSEEGGPAKPPAPAPAKPSAGAPKPGTVQDGYRFKGGNPADKANWEKV